MRRPRVRSRRRRSWPRVRFRGIIGSFGSVFHGQVMLVKNGIARVEPPGLFGGIFHITLVASDAAGI